MEDNFIVETTLGKVSGYSRQGVIKFKGIPYITPPVGNLRFKPPVPIEPWQGIYDATHYSPVCPQPPSSLETVFNDPLPQSEANGLTLNVWTQKLDDKKRPVMFFIHGGAFSIGTGRDLDGSRLVLRGDVVVVSINYRLGPFGFLYMPDVIDATANAGLLDMVVGLKWVKENIALFGGDPDNVTIFGESAGAYSVVCLLTMPSAKGLFKRAIIQSSYVTKFNCDPSTGEKTSNTLIKQLGLEKRDINALRNISFERIINELTAIQNAQPNTAIFRPVVDKNTLPVHPLDAIRTGYAKDIDVFIGTNLDETKMWSLNAREGIPFTEEALTKNVNRIMRNINQSEKKSVEIIQTYKKGRKSLTDIIDAIDTDNQYRIPSIRIAEAQSKHHQNTFMYLFSWKSPLEGGKYGAKHALDLSFVFGILLDKDISIFAGKTEETLELSGKMMDAWISFARIGNPNHDNIPKLSPYDLEKRSTIIFDKEVTIVNDPFSIERAAWDDLL
jgi:para-nitrobenzyl esterase